LKMDLKYNGVLWTGLIWFRIKTNGGLLWTRYWTFGFLRHVSIVRVWLVIDEDDWRFGNNFASICPKRMRKITRYHIQNNLHPSWDSSRESSEYKDLSGSYCCQSEGRHVVTLRHKLYKCETSSWVSFREVT
jgi:hypothetical protein